MSEDLEVKHAEITDTLVDQLGTNKGKLDDGEVDMRLLTIIRDPTEIPTSLRPRVFVATRVDVVEKGLSFWSSLKDNLDYYSVAVDGRGRRDMIRGEQVKRGIAVSVESEIRNFSIIEKHLTRRREFQEQQERDRLEI